MSILGSAKFQFSRRFMWSRLSLIICLFVELEGGRETIMLPSLSAELKLLERLRCCWADVSAAITSQSTSY